MSKHLFTARDEDGDLYDAAHFAPLIAALGPPPQAFLDRNRERGLISGMNVVCAKITVHRGLEADQYRRMERPCSDSLESDA